MSRLGNGGRPRLRRDIQATSHEDLEAGWQDVEVAPRGVPRAQPDPPRDADLAELQGTWMASFCPKKNQHHDVRRALPPMLGHLRTLALHEAAQLGIEPEVGGSACARASVCACVRVSVCVCAPASVEHGASDRFSPDSIRC